MSPSSNPAPSPATLCPCGRGADYGGCCGRLHSGVARAVTAEDLMRSRFSAFALGDRGYLRRTWDPSTCPTQITFVQGRRWTRLDVVEAEGGPFDKEGRVEFVAHHTRDGVAGQFHENSRFVRHDGRWVYVSPVATGA